MSYTLIGDKFHSDPKFLALHKDARLLYICLESYSRDHRQGGRLTRASMEAVARLQGISARRIDELATTIPANYEKPFLVEVAAGVYMLHDYDLHGRPTPDEERRRGRPLAAYPAPTAAAARDRARRQSAARAPRPKVVQVPARLRLSVLERDGYACRYCGTPVPSSQPLSWLLIDHVMPANRGGPNTPDNLVAACPSCNKRKASRTPEEAGMTLLPQVGGGVTAGVTAGVNSQLHPSRTGAPAPARAPSPSPSPSPSTDTSPSLNSDVGEPDYVPPTVAVMRWWGEKLGSRTLSRQQLDDERAAADSLVHTAPTADLPAVLEVLWQQAPSKPTTLRYFCGGTLEDYLSREAKQRPGHPLAAGVGRRVK